MGIFKSIITLFKTALNNGKQYSHYKSMSETEFLSLSDEELIEGIHVILDLDCDEIYKTNNIQLTFLAVSEFNMEVNNGGLCQFFVNSGRKYAPYISDSLTEIGATLLVNHFNMFISDSGIDLNDLSSFKIQQVEDFEIQNQRFDFDKFDDKFYKLQNEEDISALLASYVRTNLTELLNI